MNRYPLLLVNGEFGYLILPPYGVTHEDADRVKRMIDSLVVDVDPRPAIAFCWLLSEALGTGTYRWTGTKPVSAVCGFLSSALIAA